MNTSRREFLQLTGGAVVASLYQPKVGVNEVRLLEPIKKPVPIKFLHGEIGWSFNNWRDNCFPVLCEGSFSSIGRHKMQYGRNIVEEPKITFVINALWFQSTEDSLSFDSLAVGSPDELGALLAVKLNEEKCFYQVADETGRERKPREYLKGLEWTGVEWWVRQPLANEINQLIPYEVFSNIEYANLFTGPMKPTCPGSGNGSYFRWKSWKEMSGK